MAISGFVVPWEKIDQAIVALHSYRKKNPQWVLTIYHDDILTRRKLESVFDHLRYVMVDDANAVAALDHALNATDEKTLALFDVTTLCNRPILDIAHVELGEQAVVFRPDRPFELSKFNDEYARLDPRHLDRYMRSQSYFSLGTVVFNLTALREVIDAPALYANYQSPACLDRGMPKHYLNRVLAKVNRGLLPGSINVKSEAVLYRIFSAVQCMRHQVRLRQAAITNFSSPKAPWTETGKIDQLFAQIPYRMYLNAAVPVREHLSSEFYAKVNNNARRQIDRFGNYDKVFESIYDVAVL